MIVCIPTTRIDKAEPRFFPEPTRQLHGPPQIKPYTRTIMDV